VRLQFRIASVVLQPTTVCNLDCAYCYLPERAVNRRMEPGVAQAVARSVAELRSRVEVLWHAGEPLAGGLERFTILAEPFRLLEREGLVEHHVQTNGTLIDDRWCALFRERAIRVGVSLDGPEWANRERRDRAGRASFAPVLAGMAALRRNGLSFAILAVIGDESLDRAAELYEFFCQTGCRGVGVLVEEPQPVTPRSVPDQDERVVRFWAELLEAWRRDPRIEVRELSEILRWMEDPSLYNPSGREITVNMYPTVAFDGTVSLLAPEFVNLPELVAGNVLQDSLLTIAERWRETRYVVDYVEGLNACRRECAYFSHCLGGTAASKYFALGTTAGTETAFCRNSRQRPVRAILQALGRRPTPFRDLKRVVRARALQVSRLARSVGIPDAPTRRIVAGQTRFD